VLYFLTRIGEQGRAVMLELQREQFEHDERFHREILRLNIHARLNHMALHFCKYTSQIATVCGSKDAHLRERTIVDSFIICLSTANILNLDLSEAMRTNSEGYDIRDFGLRLAERRYPSIKLDDNWLLCAYAVETGKMARACEKIDHLEPFPFREKITEALIGLCEISLIAASINDIHIASAVQDRRKEIRLRNPCIATITSGHH
jgi:hypothetical protein